ncbi:hypothetical protein HYV79_04585 [Candidatus Woesearchaeota archaeon]|nr:hypothetical protein [Candidatus Woesearchaeota archaeon]
MKVVLLGILLFTILLAACNSNSIPIYEIGPSIDELEPVVKVEVQEIPVDLCKDVSCDSNQVCENGQCVCSADYKQCSNQCIEKNQCCSAKDCSKYQKCEKGVCVNVNKCFFGQVWNVNSNKCECAPDAFFCSRQNRCIPIGSCCSIKDCSGEGFIGSQCKPTLFLPRVCAGTEKSEQCKYATEGLRTSFSTLNYSLDVYIQNAYEDNSLDVKVVFNNKERLISNLASGELVFLDYSVFLRVDNLKYSGGQCS